MLARTEKNLLGNVLLGRHDYQHKDIHDNDTKRYYDDRQNMFNVMLSLIMLSVVLNVVKLSVKMQSVTMQNTFMPIVIKLSIIMLTVLYRM